jgi:PAS domain S-box
MDSTQHSARISLERFAAINRAITTSLDFKAVLQLIVVNATELFSAETGLLLLADNNGILRVRASHGRDISRVEDFFGRMEESTIRALSSRLRLNPTEALVTVPIVVNGSLNGFLALSRSSPLKEDEHWQLGLLADQTAIALNNARFHEMETGEAWRQRDETLNALRESNQKVNRILASITELFYQLDREWRFLDLNSRVEELFGKDREDLIGKVIWEVYPQTKNTTQHDRYRQAMEEQIPAHFEIESKIVAGVWFEVHAYPSETMLSVYLRDITERKQAEAKIAFRAHLLDTVEQAVIATDLEGKIIYWNSFAESLYGWSKSEAVGANILDLTPADDVKEKGKEILAHLKQSESWSGEFLVKKKDGSAFPAMVTDSPILSEQGELIGIVGVSVDITQRKRAEEERARLLASERDARAEAEKANALKDEFLATLSHELRNPLNVILGYGEVLSRSKETAQSKSLQQAAKAIKQNALAQSQLISDLLDLSRLQMGKLALNRASVSFATIINDAVETVQVDAAAKNIQIGVHGTDELLFVSADALRLKQVAWNLLNNAIKFTPTGGAIEIRLGREGNFAILVITDTGEGIDPEFLPNVFEMFRQADTSSQRKHGGMGIGLALVRRLVALHDGTVTAKSEGAGKGAEFTIKIPLCEEAKPRLKTTGEIAARYVLNGLRILIVDDSEDTTGMLRRLLEFEGATATAATSGAEALQIASQQEFDVIVTDISMPVMNGFEFLRQLRLIPSRKEVPVIAVTGFGRSEDMQRAEAAGFFSHLTKPLDTENLFEMLRGFAIKRHR